jgi:hypothetical protein
MKAQKENERMNFGGVGKCSIDAVKYTYNATKKQFTSSVHDRK